MIHRRRRPGEVQRVEPAASGLASAHVSQGPAGPHGHEALEGPRAVEPEDVHLEEPTQCLLGGVFKVMDHTATGPPDHAPDDGHKLDSGDAEAFGDRVAPAVCRMVGRMSGAMGTFSPPIRGHTRKAIVVVTKAMPAPGVEPGLPLRGEGF